MLRSIKYEPSDDDRGIISVTLLVLFLNELYFIIEEKSILSKVHRPNYCGLSTDEYESEKSMLFHDNVDNSVLARLFSEICTVSDDTRTGTAISDLNEKSFLGGKLPKCYFAIIIFWVVPV